MTKPLPEHIRLQRQYERKRRAWMKFVGFPWPDEPEDLRPDPGTIDLETIDG